MRAREGKGGREGKGAPLKLPRARENNTPGPLHTGRELLQELARAFRSSFGILTTLINVL